MVLGGFGWFWVVLGGFGWFRVLVTTGIPFQIKEINAKEGVKFLNEGN